MKERERDRGIKGGGGREGERKGSWGTVFNVFFTEVSNEDSWTEEDGGLCSA